MKGLLIVLLILLLLGMIKVGVHAFYEEKKLKLDLILSRFRLTVIGKEKKDRKPPKAKKKKTEKTPAQKKKTEASPEKKKTAGGFQKLKPWLEAVMDYWQDLFSLIGRVLSSPTLDILRLEITVGAGDAESCAMTYGKICAMVGALLPVVENTFTVKKRSVEILCFFDRDSIEITAESAITLRIYEIFALVFALLGLGLKILFQARKYKKAVQQYESSSS